MHRDRKIEQLNKRRQFMKVRSFTDHMRSNKLKHDRANKRLSNAMKYLCRGIEGYEIITYKVF